MRSIAARRPFLDPAAPAVAELEELIGTVSSPEQFPHAEGVEREVVIYRNDRLVAEASTPEGRLSVLGELATVLETGPGVLAIKGAVERSALDRVTEVFWAMVEQQRASGMAVGDHFAKAGANDRVWNVQEKLALVAPEAFVDYYSCDALALAATAWLGPNYQVSAQLNVVNPGGAAQAPHRDYHLGFMSPQQAAEYPEHVHRLSASLTLQGAIAHVDMSVESGPTKLLPHSQKYSAGYLVADNAEVTELFERRHVQLPLEAGDAVFFNPALLHAAGANRTSDVHRMANLLQTSCAFGRAMESMDRAAMSQSVYPALVARKAAGWSPERLARAIAACAEGYAFPTNLDRDPPIGGLAPPSQADVVRAALARNATAEELAADLAVHGERRLTR